MRRRLLKAGIRIVAFLIFLMLIILVRTISQNQASSIEEKPLGCISLNSSEDYYSWELAESFRTRMNEMDYRVSVTFCDYDINLQLKQLYNFLAQKAELIIIYRAGEAEAYSDFLIQAREYGCQTIVIDENDIEPLCDVSVESYDIYQGMRACELVRQYLDQEYPDAGAASVTMLLLEAGSDAKNSRISAGYKLISEKFLRYYDVTDGSFIHEEGESVLYLDQEGTLREVEEETGGLILDGNGNAQLNPYYDERIRLSTQKYLDVRSNLEGQEAIDRFMMTAEGAELRIVVALSFNSAVGAAERMQYYLDNGLLFSETSGLAVFGFGENSINRQLVQDSYEGNGLLRGFVALESASSLINGVLEQLEEGGVYQMKTTSRSEQVSSSGVVAMVRMIGSSMTDPDVFYKYYEEN